MRHGHHRNGAQDTSADSATNRGVRTHHSALRVAQGSPVHQPLKRLLRTVAQGQVQIEHRLIRFFGSDLG